jgi:hypothetical protein
MPAPTVLTAPTYGTSVNRYKKATTVLVDAIERLRWTDDADYAAEMATWDAMKLMEAAIDGLNKDSATMRKHFGIGTYTPYGRPFKRRY